MSNFRSCALYTLPKAILRKIINIDEYANKPFYIFCRKFKSSSQALILHKPHVPSSDIEQDTTWIQRCDRLAYFKANMNSDIQLQTAAIFFSDELLSETGYWLGVCHGWFHLHRLPLAARSGSEICKMKNSSCPQRDSNSRPSDWEAIALTARPRRPVL